MLKIVLRGSQVIRGAHLLNQLRIQLTTYI